MQELSNFINGFILDQLGEIDNKEQNITVVQDEEYAEKLGLQNGKVYKIHKHNISLAKWIKLTGIIERLFRKTMYRFDFDSEYVYMYMISKK